MTMRIVIFLVTLQLSTTAAWWFSEPAILPHEEISEECMNPPATDPCKFYECLERRFPCGHDQFTLNVGLYFCRKKNEHMQNFTPEGRVWLNETNQCIRQALIPYYDVHAMRCSDIRDAGAAAMLDCIDHVNEAGVDFCSFVHDNAAQYAAMISLDDVARLVSLRKPAIITQMIVDGAQCGGQLLQDRLGSLAGGFNDMVGSLLESVNGLSDRWNNLWN